jgi:hypothetical protein
MYCEIHLEHRSMDSGAYKAFVARLGVINQLSLADGLNVSRIYQNATPIVKQTIVSAGRIDHSLVIFITYGQWSTWHIESPTGDTASLFSCAKKVGEKILSSRKHVRELKLGLTDISFSDENNEAIKIEGQTVTLKTAWKKSIDKLSLVPSLFQSFLTWALLYLILGDRWLSTDEPAKLIVSALVLVAGFIVRLPGAMIMRRNKIFFSYKG